MTIELSKDALDNARNEFEEWIFKRYYISMINADLTLKGSVKTKLEFCKRFENEYEDDHVQAGWCAWQEQERRLQDALEQASYDAEDME